MKPYGTARLKRLLREIGRMEYPEMRAFFDELGPQRTKDLNVKVGALYDSEKTEPGNLHDPWASDPDLSRGAMFLADEAGP
jgi:hypothetical protein